MQEPQQEPRRKQVLLRKRDVLLALCLSFILCVSLAALMHHQDRSTKLTPGSERRGGFTLIELSIVLVIIGLIVGGVLVGQDLIRAAEVRATISQIEKYNTAVNTFRGKYGYLPGDIKDPDATNFGFIPRGPYSGQGDGNGILQGNPDNYGWEVADGETGVFWVDLSTAHLIDGNFSTATSTSAPASNIIGSSIDLYFPQAKMGRGNYVYAWSGGENLSGGGFGSLAINYFGIAGVTEIITNGKLENTATNMTVSEAHAIDQKLDDGLPLTGHVLAIYLSNDPLWLDGTNTLYDPPPTQTSGSSTSCFDNSGISGALEQYSLQQNGGAGANCALSFEFQ